MDSGPIRAEDLGDLPPPPVSTLPPSPAAQAVAEVVGYAAMAALGGMLAGVFWGGIGGRIAMRVVFLTSQNGVRGITSDDGFEIGVISLATVFLMIASAFGGAFGGFFVGLVRPFLRGPRWLAAAAMGITAGAGVGGGMVINAEGIDFKILEPLWLLVALFIILPVGWGVTTVYLTDRLTRPGTRLSAPFLGLSRYHGGLAATTLAWLILLVITVVGLVDLADDIERLT